MNYNLNRVLAKVAERSNGQMVIKKVPPEMRPTAEGLAKLDREIKAQVDRNNYMAFKSVIEASKTNCN